MTTAPQDPSPDADAGPLLTWTEARRVEVRGTDRLGYLDDVTSQALRDLTPGVVRGALHLDQHGAPLAMFDVLVLAESLALIAPDAAVAATLVDVLGARTFLLDARFEAREDRVVAVRGADADRVASAVNLGGRPGTVRPAGDGLVVVGRDGGGIDLVGSEEALAPAVEGLTAAGARPVGPDEFDAWRVRAGVPAWNREVAAPHLPEESGVLATHVHLAKGCYPGQEAVARMWMLGRPRRRLARVEATGTSLRPGWTVGSGRQAVTVTSATADGTRALAFVPRDAAVGAVLDGGDTTDGGEVRVLGFVGDDLVAPGHDPDVPRRRDRGAHTGS